jgi:hypothetical protein
MLCETFRTAVDNSAHAGVAAATKIAATVRESKVRSWGAGLFIELCLSMERVRLTGFMERAQEH